MTFTVTRVRDREPVQFEKVGRLLPDGDGIIRLMKDGSGEVMRIPKTDCILLFAGLTPDGMHLSESGNRVILIGPAGENYIVLTSQIRGMIEQWPKKKAAVFVIHDQVIGAE